MLDFDTGSADTWVCNLANLLVASFYLANSSQMFSKALSSSKEKGHNVFDPEKSSTYEPLSGKS